MNKGVVLEVRGKSATVLTPDGRFLRVRVPAEGWYPGDEVTWGRTGVPYLRPALVMVCLLVLLMVPAAVAYQHLWGLGPVVAYVSVDINPSLEFGVDARERVCVARALNSDGEEVLSGLPCRGRSLHDVLTDVTLRAVEKGYVRGEGAGAILVTVTPVAGRDGLASAVPPKGGDSGPEPDIVSGSGQPTGSSAISPSTAGTAPSTPEATPSTPESTPSTPSAGRPGAGARTRRTLWERLPWYVSAPDPARMRDEAVKVASRVLDQRGVKAAVKGLAASAEVHEEAERLNVSAGRLALFVVARDAGIEVNLEQFRSGPVAEIIFEALGRQLGKDGQGGQGQDAPQGQGPAERQGPGESEGPGEQQGPGERQQPGERQGAGQRRGQDEGKPALPGGSAVPGAPGQGSAEQKEEKGAETGGEERQGRIPGQPGAEPGGREPSAGTVGGRASPRGPDSQHLSPRELLEKLWEKAGLEKELPELMKKFLPQIDRHGGKSGEKDRPGGR